MTPPAGALPYLMPISIAFSVVAILQLTWFITYVLVFEGNVNKLTPFNISLFAMVCATVGMFISAAIAYSPGLTDSQRNISGIIGLFCPDSIEVAYLYYSWKRGAPIVEIVAPSALPYLRVLLIMSPLAYYSGATICAVANMIGQGQSTFVDMALLWTNSAAVLITVAFDVIFAYSFLRLLHSHRAVGLVAADSSQKSAASAHSDFIALGNEKLLTIAKYGLASVASAIVLVIIYILQSFESNPVVFAAYDAFIDLLITLYFTVLLAMKVSLRSIEDKMSKKKEIQLEQNIGKTELKRIRNRQ